MVRESRKRGNPGLTCECTPNYLWFSETDYDSMGGFIKCNPSIKKPLDRKALRAALADGTIDTIGSDHAPHLQEEKLRPYLSCPSGVPSIEQSLAVMLTVAYKEGIPMERVASLMSENTASLFGIRDRGRIAEGAFADLVAIDPEMEFSVGEKDAATSSARIDYKCGWSPYGPLKLADGRFKGGEILRGGVKKVWLNGVKSVEDGKLLATAPAGQALVFDR
jgi:dihydroorotase